MTTSGVEVEDPALLPAEDVAAQLDVDPEAVCPMRTRKPGWRRTGRTSCGPSRRFPSGARFSASSRIR